MRTLLEMGLSNALMAMPLALLAAVASRVCRRPAFSHCLWLLVLLKLLTPPFWHVPLPWPAAGTHTAEVTGSLNTHEVPADFWRLQLSETELAEAQRAVESSQPEAAPASLWQLMPLETSPALEGAENRIARLPDWSKLLAWVPSSWLDAAAGLWLTSALVWFGWTARCTWRFQRLLAFAQPAPAELQEELHSLAARLGIAAPPRIYLVPGAVSPMLWAIGRIPRLLFPARLLEHLDKEQRSTLLVHELAHFRRRDHWVRLVEMLALGLYWWHPVVWWARHALREAEEQCCDAWVVWALASADRAYATALLQTVAFFSQARCILPAAASGIGQVRHLRRRLTMIMQGKTPRSLSWTGLLAVLALGLFLLPFLPVRAQDDPKVYKVQTGGDGTDQKIAELKKLLQSLEEQKRSEKSNGAAQSKEQSAEAEKARAEASALGKQVKIKHAELRQLEQRHQEALARLAKLEGKAFSNFFIQSADGKSFAFSNNQPYVVKDGKTWSIQDGKSHDFTPYYFNVKPDTAKVPQNFYWTYKDQSGVESKVTKEDLLKNKLAVVKPPAVSRDKSADLEKRLEKLSREFEELRRELKQGRGEKGPQSY